MIDLATPGARDSWCTPSWLTDLLPLVDIDPCSNAQSTVRAKTTYSLEAGTDGLALPWFGLVWCNPPYSDVLPWAERLQDHMQMEHPPVVHGAAFLINTDHSTKWWKVLCSVLPMRFDFSKRIQFKPPPGVAPSTNRKPQTLLCTETFWRECDERLAQHGTLWRRW